MAPDDETAEVSPQAFERVRRERDDLKAQAAEAAKALGDVALRDAAYEHFKRGGVSDPYGVASLALRDVTLRGTAADQLPAKLDAWLQEQRALWTPPTATPTGEPEPKPNKPSPYQGPNPGAPGSAATFEPMVVGSPKWKEWSKGKSGEEQVAAVKRGEAVVPESVRTAQRTIHK